MNVFRTSALTLSMLDFVKSKVKDSDNYYLTLLLLISLNLVLKVLLMFFYCKL